MKMRLTLFLVVAWFLASLPAFGQGDRKTRIEIPFSNPDRAGLVKFTFSDENVTILGYEGKSVIVERGRGDNKTANAASPEQKLKAIGETDVDAHEADNVITLRGLSRKNLTIQVPRKTSLQITCTQTGNIRVENVDGEIEASGRDGSITVDGGSGPLLASIREGNIIAHFDSLPATKLISLRSLDGNIELTLGKEAKANVTLEALEGRVNTDFKLEQKQYPRVKSGVKLTGTLNGGGAEVHLATHEGHINLLINKTPAAIEPNRPSTTPKQK
jgi:hypothetical protein